jgi:hypothetical protein
VHGCVEPKNCLHPRWKNRLTPAIAVVNAETSTKLDHISEEHRQNEVDDDDDVNGAVNLTLQDITEHNVTQPPHPRGIPTVKFLDNVTQYVQSFCTIRYCGSMNWRLFTITYEIQVIGN